MQAPAQNPILASSDWQMTLGERAALEGLLAVAKPTCAVEIGTANGGSLRRIAHHSAEVHSFDLIEPAPELQALSNVTFHTGDSHELVSAALREFACRGQGVDFVLVDGDHTGHGVRQDVEDLLASPALAGTVLVLHDTMNEEVRNGLEQINFETYSNVFYVDLDFVPGHVSAEGPLGGELWGGLGLILTQGDRAPDAGPPMRPPFESLFELVRNVRSA